MTRPRPATFSIAARDPETHAVGVAVHSRFVSVGSVVPFVSADAGAIATQSFANVEYGPEGLDLLRRGYDADAVVETLTARDAEAPQRQVGVIEAPARGDSVAAFTGDDCFDVAGDLQGDHYTVQGNILENRETLTAMADAFEDSEARSASGSRAQPDDADGGLPERMLAALQAGNDTGGDSRGEQSAALYVAKPEGGYDGGNDRWIDVRVDDHETPIAELDRVFKLYDVTLLERAEPEETRELTGETAEEVLETLAALGFYDGAPTGEFEDDARDALEEFRGMNNFENHSLAVLEDALARGWADATGDGEARMVDAIWHGLQRLDRE